MNELIKELAAKAGINGLARLDGTFENEAEVKKFAELIVKEMCGLMEQTEDDVYHCFEPSERPTEYIEWLRDWQERFTKHFGVDNDSAQ